MRLTLGTKLVLAIAAIAAVAILIAVQALVFTQVIAATLRETVASSLPNVKAAEEIEIALSDQESFFSAYVLSKGDRSWLERMHASRAEGKRWLASAWAQSPTAEESDALRRLETSLADYDANRDKVVQRFKPGQAGEVSLADVNAVWEAYQRAYRHCEELIDLVDGDIRSTTERAERYGAVTAWSVTLGSLGVAGLAAILVWLLVRRVFIPLRRMAADARLHIGQVCDPGGEVVDDEVRSVGDYYRTIMADAVKTRTTLEVTQNRMWNAEKLAAVGKLAASVAHEMRNPLSSMKMWLYSIRKTARAEPSLDHKYQILADEISRLESIVRNVLEFSRPPSLKPRPHCIAPIVEQTLEIVRPWLEAKKIGVTQRHTAGLPQVMVDAEQLKQVFVNLLDNSAEAMPCGGEISISSMEEADASGAGAVVVRIHDTGQGIPEDVRSRLFEPFFTTKEKGTGLGLCIAANIMAAQGGCLVLESSTSDGTTFALRFPMAVEKNDGEDSRR